MKKELVEKISKETEEGYDLVSEKFSQTRNRFWAGLEFVSKYAKEGGKVLDFGCGNGRLIEILKNKNIDYVGVDVSRELITLAKDNYKNKSKFKNIEFVKIDHNFEKLSFSDNFFDATYSIAVFHHFPGKENRHNKAKELYRVTKPGGYIAVTVWDLWQRKYFKMILENWINKIKGKSEVDWNDAWISFTDNKGRKFNRYHHAFTKNDLRKTFRKSGFEVEKITKIAGNIVLIGKK